VKLYCLSTETYNFDVLDTTSNINVVFSDLTATRETSTYNVILFKNG
jgi:hypothetical protein